MYYAAGVGLKRMDRRQMRQIIGSEGWVTFNSLDAVIGMGDATVIDTLRFEWPSGIVQELHNVPGQQTLTVVERTDLAIAANGTGEFDLMLKGPRHQRYRVDVSTNLLNWSSSTLLTVTNADGTVSFKYQPADSEPRMFFRGTPE